ncbi:MAG: acyltransferase family protein [Frankiales bacterium]|nr:acyltransferase family protein [Frankiales bacterium]
MDARATADAADGATRPSPAAHERARSFRFRPDVEGLRAVAIAAVVGYHVGLPLFGGGFVGVDVFFVISGFLITGLLVTEVASTGHVSLSRFWARRARRLLPAATLVLALVAAVSWWVVPVLDHGTTGLDIAASALYVSNMRFAAQATDYLASDAATSPVLHFWSLGVEEQFYLVWPLLVLVVGLVVVRRRRAAGGAVTGPLMGTLALLGVLSFLLSLRLTDRVEPWAFFGMPTRAWEFALGGLVAIGAPHLGALPVAARRTAGVVGLALVAGSVVLLSNDLPYPGTAALWPVLGTTLVIAAGTGGPGRVGVLTLWPVRALGRLSYSWYLWHWPALVLTAAALGDLGVGGRLAVALLSLVPAALAYRFVERPLHHHPALVASPGRSLRLGAALSLGAATAGLLLAVLPGGGALASSAAAAPGAADEQTGRGPAALATPQPSGSGPSAPAPSASGAARPTQAPVVWPAGPLTPSPQDARSDIPVIYGDGCHLPKQAVSHPACVFGDPSSSTVVVLFGDSHAAQWFPALRSLADKHHWKLLVRTKSGCPAPDVTIFDRALKRPYDECDQWRTQVMTELTSTHPTLVVAAGTRTDSLVDRSTGSKIAASAAPGEWQAGWRRDLDALGRAGVPVAVLRDTPWPGRDVPSCVAQNLSDPSACDLSRSALDSPSYDTALTRGTATGHGVDLTSVICEPSRCPVTRGKYLVYRDGSHLTATFAEALAPYLYQRLAPLLPH